MISSDDENRACTEIRMVGQCTTKEFEASFVIVILIAHGGRSTQKPTSSALFPVPAPSASDLCPFLHQHHVLLRRHQHA
jgi:hypothetical protein